MKLLKKNQITRLEEKAMSNLTGGAQDPCYAGCGWCTPGEGPS